ncbi:hypothetical protein [Paraflavitalea pollutisoli]|uniref:hypothetical protein n=1 Tax=Paraflavitalea pollutisoli TaxID=3034143 RepID=UPI0023EC53A6|nr:hypothetical protein [Paraflavitalea sp. H1-2-19X]
MKHTVKNCAIVLGILLACTFQSSAQEFKTDESIGSQLKNGTAPGLKFGPSINRSARVAKAAKDPNEGRETAGSLIKRNSLKGVQYAGGGGVARSAQRSIRPAARLQGNSNLPSDQKAVEQKPVTPVNPGILPTQDAAIDSKEGKKALPAKPILQSKKQD